MGRVEERFCEDNGTRVLVEELKTLLCVSRSLGYNGFILPKVMT